VRDALVRNVRAQMVDDWVALEARPVPRGVIFQGDEAFKSTMIAIALEVVPDIEGDGPS